MYLGKEPEFKFIQKGTKFGRWKLHSFDTEIDAQACNVSYLQVLARGVETPTSICLFVYNKMTRSIVQGEESEIAEY